MTEQVRMVRIDAVAFDDLEVRNLELAVMPDSAAVVGDGIDGALGQDFFAAVDLEIDFAAGRVRMYRSGTMRANPERRADLAAIPFSYLAGSKLMQVAVDVGDARSVPAIFDLGASGSTANLILARQAHLTPRPNADGEDAVAMGAAGQPIACTIYDAGALKVGGVALSLSVLTACDLPVYETLHMADAPAMVLGLDLLVGRRLVIDFANREMLVSRALR